MLFIMTVSYCQQTKPRTDLTRADYLQKSKRQKTAAWLLLGGGTTVGFIGLANINLAGTDDPDGVNNTPGTLLFVTGLASAIASIPMFTASARNKRKAMNLSFKKQMIPQLQNYGLTFRSVPSVNIKISF